jgi:hypothetical protein
MPGAHPAAIFAAGITIPDSGRQSLAKDEALS